MLRRARGAAVIGVALGLELAKITAVVIVLAATVVLAAIVIAVRLLRNVP